MRNYNKITKKKQRKYRHVGTFAKYIRNIVERGAIDTLRETNT